MKHRNLPILAVSIALLVPAALAHADELPAWTSGIDIAVGPEMSPMSVDAAVLAANSASVVENPDGSVTFMNGSMTMAGMWEWTWMSIILDPDPSVSFVGGFTNVSAMAQNFILSTTSPVSPQITPSSLYGGSTSATYGDANFDGLGGLINSTLGGAAYIGTIDGSGQLDMLAIGLGCLALLGRCQRS